MARSIDVEEVLSSEEERESQHESSREVSEQVELEEGMDDIFVVRGEPLGFWFHDRLPRNHVRTLSRLVTEHGGKICLEESDADVIIASENYIDVFQRKYWSHPSVYTELPSFIRESIERRKFEPHLPARKGMGGPSKSRRTECLCKFLARVVPSKSQGGRAGNVIWKRAVEDAYEYGENHINGWAKRHPWQAWREHYKMHQEELDPIIERLAKQNPPVNKALYERDRRRGRAGRKAVQHHVDEVDSGDEEDEEAEPNHNGPESGKKRAARQEEEEEEAEEVEVEGADANAPIVISDSDDNWSDDNDPFWKPHLVDPDDPETGPSGSRYSEPTSPIKSVRHDPAMDPHAEPQSVSGKMAQRRLLAQSSQAQPVTSPSRNFPASSQVTLVNPTQSSRTHEADEDQVASHDHPPMDGPSPDRVQSVPKPRKKPAKRRRVEVVLPPPGIIFTEGPPAQNTRARSRSVEPVQMNILTRKGKGKQKATMDRVEENMDEDEEQDVSDLLNAGSAASGARASAPSPEHSTYGSDDGRTQEQLFLQKRMSDIATEPRSQATHRIHQPRYSYGRDSDKARSLNTPSAGRRTSLPNHNHLLTIPQKRSRSRAHDFKTPDATQKADSSAVSSFKPPPGTRAAALVNGARQRPVK
ncbi:unnamed protein product [Somion occarium]|uniref:DNA-binding protein RAP1 n=1 Tax=Somion occarium TaxID=3059160 RepID=A0ABP1D8W6_9APHY